jgi:hypothetical protein
MKKFKVDFMQAHSVTIEAPSAAKARERFMSADWDPDLNVTEAFIDYDDVVVNEVKVEKA